MNMQLSFWLYYLMLSGIATLLLLLLRPEAILSFVLGAVLVVPAYDLFERGRTVLGVVSFFCGIVTAALLAKVLQTLL